MAKLAEFAANDRTEEEEDDDDDLDDDDYLWSKSDSYYYKSKFEEQEAPLFFRDVLQTLKEEKIDTYNAIIALLSDDQKDLLENIVSR